MDGEEGEDRRPQTQPDEAGAVHHLLRHLEHLLLHSEQQVVADVGGRVLPAWRRVTEGEPRWPVSVGVVAAVVLQVTLPDEVVVHPRWALPAIATVLLIVLVAANPKRINRQSPALRALGLLLIAVISLSNAWSAGQLVTDLVRGHPAGDATRLLLTGGAIWLTNVLAFALWYWELDRGGPVNRAHASRQHVDFLFVQISFSLGALLRWRDAAHIDVPVYAGVLVLASNRMAKRVDVQRVEANRP